MASLDFYATINDHQAVLNDLFQQGDFRIFEAYSAFDNELREFDRPSDILEILRATNKSRYAVLLQIWARAASTAVEIQRFPVSVEGYSFRHRIAGWGLFQLYLSKESGAELTTSHFGHFSEKGATKWADPELPGPANPGSAADWDWELLHQLSRRIQSRIKTHFSATKMGSRPILHDAARLIDKDHVLPLR